MEPKTSSTLDQLYKSIQTFGTLTMAAESRDKLYRYNDALMQSIHSILTDCDCDEATKLETFNTTLEQYTAAMKELFPQIISGEVVKADAVPKTTISKADPNRFDVIVEVEKFNPYHDSAGRFATADSHTLFTVRTKDPAKQHMADMAIAREKERSAAAEAAAAAAKPKKQPKKETAKPKEENATISATGETSLPDNVLSKCRDVEAKTVNRKTEKMTLIDGDGNIILEKSGGRGSVSFGLHETMQMDETTTLTHNHPGEFGGTFSGADVKVLVVHELKAIRAAAKEGTYSLERTSATNSSNSVAFMQEYAKRANSVNRSIKKEYTSMKSKVARGETSVDDANKQLADHRTSLCNDQHDWLVKNASQYGYNYVFEPSSGGVTKMFDDIEKEEVEDTTGEITLDGEFINGDSWMIKGDESDAE